MLHGITGTYYHVNQSIWLFSLYNFFWNIELIHKSNANDYFREVKDRQIRLSLLEKARQIYEKHGFEHLTVSKRVENLAPEGWDRGTSCLHILRSLYGVDWEERVKVSLRV